MRESYDVVIVGAGPAGSTTARWAARGGASTLLIEKRQEVGSPVRCGEGISVDWLPKVDLKLDRRWVANQVDAAWVHSPSDYIFKVGADLAGDEVGAVIERDIFDKYLAEEAVRAGAELHLRTACIGLERKNGMMRLLLDRMGERAHVDCGALVCADGYESQVGRWAGLDTTVQPHDVMTCLQYRMVRIDVDPTHTDFYLSNKKIPGGYAWVFPKGADTANVGIGVQVSRLKEPGETRKYLDLFVKEHPGLAKGCATEIVAGGVSVCQPLEKTVADNLMLVGDAARQIDPITGGGIANSCKSGKVCGEVAALATQEKDFSAASLDRYERGWRDLIENNLYRNWMAKERMLKLSDDDFDKIIETMSQIKIESLSVLGILSAIRSRYPELVKEFDDLM